MESFIAGRFGHFVTNSGKQRAESELTAEELSRIETIVQQRNPSALFYTLAASSLERSGLVSEPPSKLRGFGDDGFWRATPLRSQWPVVNTFAVNVLLLISVMFAIFLLTQGLVLRLAGGAIVNGDGQVVSRIRGACRTTFAAFPVAVVLAAVAAAEDELLGRYGGGYDPWSSWPLYAAYAAMLIWVIGCVSSIRNPERGVLDRITRTWVVAR
jgi:hypothetical protein